MTKKAQLATIILLSAALLWVLIDRDERLADAMDEVFDRATDQVEDGLG